MSHSGITIWKKFFNISEALFKNKAISGVTVLDKELGVLYHQELEGEEYEDSFILKSSDSITHDDETLDILKYI